MIKFKDLSGFLKTVVVAGAILEALYVLVFLFYFFIELAYAY